MTRLAANISQLVDHVQEQRRAVDRLTDSIDRMGKAFLTGEPSVSVPYLSNLVRVLDKKFDRVIDLYDGERVKEIQLVTSRNSHGVGELKVELDMTKAKISKLVQRSHAQFTEIRTELSKHGNKALTSGKDSSSMTRASGSSKNV